MGIQQASKRYCLYDEYKKIKGTYKTGKFIWVCQKIKYSTKEAYEADRLKLILASKGRVLAKNFVIKYSYVPSTKIYCL